MIPRSFRVSGLGLYDRTPIDTWHRGRVVLCGDSAHPVTPIGGQVTQLFLLILNNPDNSIGLSNSNRIRRYIGPFAC